ncbi:hypothetical protein [Nonomuraea sp. NPDC023979]|uniref:hypothetical protein n=1 Tax=Nonomuraea sp. NPDC023979 TaxID=3154796 RepID=UPI0034031C97
MLAELVRQQHHMGGEAGAGVDGNVDERMSYLRKSAGRGVDTYKLLYSQEAKIDKARCERAFDGSGASKDMPPDTDTGHLTAQWRAQVKEFFVDSCLSGKPKPVPGELPNPSTAPSTPSPVPTST